MKSVLWMRLGDGGNYESFDGMAEVANKLREQNIFEVSRVRGGITTPGFEGNNYISLYWGLANNSNLSSEINDDEIQNLRRFLLDSSKIVFVKPCELIVVTDFDEDNEIVSETTETLIQGSIVEVEFLEHRNAFSDIQFPDGSVAFQVPNELFQTLKDRLEFLRKQLRAECISFDELFELQSLAEHIDDDDVELLEAAGVPEMTPDE